MKKLLLINLNDLETLAARKLPKMAYDYFARGAADEKTLEDNLAAFHRRKIIPRVLREVENRDLSTTVLGQKLSFPALVAPIAFNGLAHPKAEIATARGAASAGTIMIASVASNEPIEKIVKASSGPVWFQTNIYKNRELTRNLVKRAEASGCKAIVLTVDAIVWGLRESDTRNRFRLPRRLSMANFKGEAIPHQLPKNASGSALALFRKTWIEENAGWKDIEWLRSITQLPLLIKGIQHPEDAKLAVRCGAQGIIVSNHGGRQLDTAQAALDALVPIADALSGSAEILMDGGIRRGTDILKALACGAKAVCVGRPVIWGLAAEGASGVTQMFEILKNEFSVAMALSGCRNVTEVTRDRITPVG